MSRANLRIVVNNEQHVPKEITAFTKEAHKISDEAFVVKTTIKKRLNKLIAQMEVNPTAEQTAKYSIAQTKVDVESLKSCLMAVRRQTLWDHWGLFLRDTFLPIASPV